MENNLDELRCKKEKLENKTSISLALAIGSTTLFCASTYIFSKKPVAYQDIVFQTTGLSMIISSSWAVNNLVKYTLVRNKYNKAVYMEEKNNIKRGNK